MTHGITNRMTGGGTGRCLQTTEAGGMGEGWSDAMAEWTEQKSATVSDFTMGTYVINSKAYFIISPAMVQYLIMFHLTGAFVRTHTLHQSTSLSSCQAHVIRSLISLRQDHQPFDVRQHCLPE
jgi:hypothetical protein